MTIKHIEPIAVSLPMKKPVFMAGLEIRQADNMLLRIEAENGIVGWGEAAAAPTMTGETVESMMAAVSYLAPALIGRSTDDIAGAIGAMRNRMYGNQAAKAAIEIALHDLLGHATAQPAYAMLGGKRRNSIPLLGILSNGDLEGDCREASRMKAEGYTALKIKVGIDKPLIDAERTRRVCATIGRGLLMCADANQGWSTTEAIQYVKAVAGCGLDFFEQPVLADDLAGMAAVAAAADCAIGTDEGVHGLQDLRLHHQQEAAQGASLKTIKLGGMRGVMAAGALCEQLGMAVNLACKTGESSIACAAAVHIGAALPQVAWALSITSGGLAEDVTTHPIRGERGHVAVPEGPGLGIEVDEDRVRRYRRDFAVRQVA